MKIYLATSGAKAEREAIAGSGAKNILMSFANWHSPGLLAGEIEGLMIDSGAFSAWQSGKAIDVQEYIAFVESVRQEFAHTTRIVIVNLDVIPGSVGNRPSGREIEESAAQGWANYELLRSRLGEVIHVFHQHEDWEWLERLADSSDYIGISPANDEGTAAKMNWLRQVFMRLQSGGYISGSNSLKTHGFGFTLQRGLMEFPFFSVDSTTWCRNGLNAKYWIKVERDISAYWRSRGIWWDE